MFKALMLCLLAVGAHADVKNSTPVEILNGGLPGTPSGSLTYALNQALTGTSSAAIDLSGTVGLWVSLTSTSGVTPSAASTNVLVYFSNSNVTYTTGAVQMYILQSPGSYPIPQKARYVSFYNGGSFPTTRVSAFYYSVVAPATSFTGTISGTVTQGAAGSAAWPVAITPTVTVDPKGSSVVAYLASSYVWVSSTGYAVTTAGTAINISSAAGASCTPCEVLFQANASGYFGFGNVTYVPSTLGTTTGFTVTANVTPILKSGFIDGQFLYVKGQAGTVQFVVEEFKRQ